MRLVLFLVLLSVPLVELALLIKLGQSLGFWTPFLVVVATALLGAAVLHRQGFATMQRASQMARSGRPPLEPAIDGVFLLVAGALLLTPGLLTDAAGLLLLVPPIRRWIAHWGFSRLMRVATFEMHTSRTTRRGAAAAPPNQDPAEPHWDPRRPAGGARPSSGDADGPVIDGDFVRVDEQDQPPRR